MAEDGLHGSFDLTTNAGGGTRAKLTFPKEPQ
jgi:hypothetical protein